MADTALSLQRLILSATDLKLLTSQQKPGEPWPDALIEDYLNILRDLVLLADIIDQNAQETVLEILRLSQNSAVNLSLVSKSRAEINKLKVSDKNLEQLIYAW